MLDEVEPDSPRYDFKLKNGNVESVYAPDIIEAMANVKGDWLYIEERYEEILS